MALISSTIVLGVWATHLGALLLKGVTVELIPLPLPLHCMRPILWSFLIRILYQFIIPAPFNFMLVHNSSDHRPRSSSMSSPHSSFSSFLPLGASRCTRLFSVLMLTGSALLLGSCSSSGWFMSFRSLFSQSPLASFYNQILLSYFAYSQQSRPMSLHSSTRKRRHSRLSGDSWQMDSQILRAFWKLPIRLWQDATMSLHFTSLGWMLLARSKQKHAFSYMFCLTQQMPSHVLVSRLVGSNRYDSRQQCRACCSSSSRKKILPTRASTPASLGSLVRMIWYHFRACLVLPMIQLMWAIWKMVSGIEITVWIFYRACHQGNIYLKGLHEVVQFLVHVAQVVKCLHAVGLDAYGLQIVLLGPAEVILHEEAVALVDEGPGVVPVVVDGDVNVFLGLVVVSLQEVQETDVGGHPRHGCFVLLLQALQCFDCLLDLFLLQVSHGFEDLDLGLDLRIG